MTVKQISMVLIYVSDVAQSVDWYRETLELPVLYQDGGFASLGVGNQRLGLHAKHADTGQVGGDSSIPVFGVDDFSEAKSLLESRGCEFFFENQTPSAIFGSFNDPDGNPLQIMQDL